MNVKTAKKFIADIEEIAEAAVVFEERHPELEVETGFIVDALGYLGDYKKLIEKEIEKAELRI